LESPEFTGKSVVIEG